MKIQSYRELIAYQKAYQLTLDIYKTTKKFPKEELDRISDAEKRGVSPLQYRRGLLQKSQKGICSVSEHLLWVMR
jgi:hypothetical protein